LTTEQIYGAD
jgi:hypothetical protein